MELFIYTERDAAAVEPGDTIAHPKGPMVVDETRSNLVGVDLYGRNPGVESGLRRRLHLESHETARVLPDFSTMTLIWGAIMYAVDFTDAAGRDPGQTRDDDGPSLSTLAGPGAVLNGPHGRTGLAALGDDAPGRIVVTIRGGQIWYVEPQYPEAAAKPDDEASEGT